jgi:hypothetical protein
MPCGKTPASVPNAIGTPIRSAILNVSPWAAAAARAFSAIFGGNVSTILVTQ